MKLYHPYGLETFSLRKKEKHNEETRASARFSFNSDLLTD
jgi:hypothetical protein